MRWSVPCLPRPRDVPSWEQVVSGSHGQPRGGRALTSPELASTARQGDTDRQKASWGQAPREARACRWVAPSIPCCPLEPLGTRQRGSDTLTCSEGTRPYSAPCQLCGLWPVAPCS